MHISSLRTSEPPSRIGLRERVGVSANVSANVSENASVSAATTATLSTEVLCCCYYCYSTTTATAALELLCVVSPARVRLEDESGEGGVVHPEGHPSIHSSSSRWPQVIVVASQISGRIESLNKKSVGVEWWQYPVPVPSISPTVSRMIAPCATTTYVRSSPKGTLVHVCVYVCRMHVAVISVCVCMQCRCPRHRQASVRTNCYA